MRKIVLVTLGGGNDAQNLLISKMGNELDLYHQYRPTIGLKDNVMLDLGSGTDIGVHPAASALVEMYKRGILNIVANTHYENPNKSHFKGTDIIWSAKDGNTVNEVGTGFIGQWMDTRFPEYPTKYPNMDMLDPVGLAMGMSVPSLWSSRSTGGAMGLTINNDPLYFRSAVLEVDQPIFGYGTSIFSQLVSYIDSIDRGGDLYSARMSNTFKAASNTSTYPDGRMSAQLANVARMIGGGAETPVYLVSNGGFDTHSKQVVGGDTHLGTHADLLEDTFGGILAFYEDLEAMGVADDVLICTVTEFGRQVKENGSLGTDHGANSPMFVVGKGVKGGMTGSLPSLANLAENGVDYADFEFDYRSVFSSLLKDWLGAGDKQLENSGLKGFGELDLVEKKYTGTLDTDFQGNPVVIDSTGGSTGGGGVDPDPDPDPVLSPPTNLSITNIDSQGFAIHWSYPENTEGILAYRVMVDDTVFQDSEDNYAKPTGLLPDQEYKVSVASLGENGMLSSAIEMMVKTAIEVDPDPDPDPVNDPLRVVVCSDYAPEGTGDLDEFVSMGFLFMCALDRLNVSRVVVGGLPTTSDDPLADFESNILPAFKASKVALGIDYEPIVSLADTNETKFDSYDTIQLSDMPNISTLIGEVESGAYLLNWGMLTEYALLCKYLEENSPEVLAKVKIVSHATAPESAHNCARDLPACQYLKSLASQGKIKFYELGLSGANGIDDRNGNTGILDDSVLDTELGKLFEKKWLSGKPDFSDGITLVVLGFPEIMGDNYLEKLEHDGTDNFDTILADFKAAGGKQMLYDIIEAKADLIKGGSTDPDPDPNDGGGDDNPTPTPTVKLRIKASVDGEDKELSIEEILALFKQT